jgi:hypothetical protein
MQGFGRFHPQFHLLGIRNDEGMAEALADLPHLDRLVHGNVHTPFLYPGAKIIEGLFHVRGKAIPFVDVHDDGLTDQPKINIRVSAQQRVNFERPDGGIIVTNSILQASVQGHIPFCGRRHHRGRSKELHRCREGPSGFYFQAFHVLWYANDFFGEMECHGHCDVVPQDFHPFEFCCHLREFLLKFRPYLCRNLTRCRPTHDAQSRHQAERIPARIQLKRCKPNITDPLGGGGEDILKMDQ